MALCFGIEPLEHNRELLLEISENEVVLETAFYLEVVVESLDGGETEVEKKCLGGGTDPNERRHELVDKEHAFLLLAFAPDSQRAPEHKLFVELNRRVHPCSIEYFAEKCRIARLHVCIVVCQLEGSLSGFSN